MGEQSGKALTRESPQTLLGKFVSLLSKVVNPLTSKIGLTIAAVILFSMMLLTFVDVAGRFLLNKPVNGSLELTEFMMGLIVAFAIGFTAFRKGHIRVDIIMQYVPRKVNLWMDVFAYLLSSVFYIFIAWQTWLNGISVMNSKLTSAVLLIPSFPFVFTVAVASAFIALVFFRDFLNAIDEVGK
jgi:TRAP-type C4-dicarboxylate transport system permease small subunit